MLDAVDREMPREDLRDLAALDQTLAKRRREIGKVNLKPTPGPLATKGAMFQEWLPGFSQRNPDLTLEGLWGKAPCTVRFTKAG